MQDDIYKNFKNQCIITNEVAGNIHVSFVYSMLRNMDY